MAEKSEMAERAEVTGQDDWQAGWEETRTWQRRRAALLSPQERLDWLESTKRMVAAAWRARQGTEPGFSPPGDWWQLHAGPGSASLAEPAASRRPR